MIIYRLFRMIEDWCSFSGLLFISFALGVQYPACSYLPIYVYASKLHIYN